jgi:hypothetical protein
LGSPTVEILVVSKTEILDSFCFWIWLSRVQTTMIPWVVATYQSRSRSWLNPVAMYP